MISLLCELNTKKKQVYRPPRSFSSNIQDWSTKNTNGISYFMASSFTISSSCRPCDYHCWLWSRSHALETKVTFAIANLLRVFNFYVTDMHFHWHVWQSYQRWLQCERDFPFIYCWLDRREKKCSIWVLQVRNGTNLATTSPLSVVLSLECMKLRMFF